MSLLNWLISTLAILVAAYLIPGITVTWLAALVLAIVLGLINAFIKPVLFILTLPINILTLGLFSLILNALIVLFVSYFVPGFTVAGFWPAFFFSILVSLINALFGANHYRAR